MRLSRDEAREIAVTAVLLTIGFRILAGVLQAAEELQREWTGRSVLGRFLAPVGSTLGMLSLAVVMVIVLSPTGSIGGSLRTATERVVGLVMLLGAASTLNSLTSGFGGVANQLWFTMINGVAALILAGAGWWILRNFDPDR
jgi:type IV secretory pathway VirB2 component (pilin)